MDVMVFDVARRVLACLELASDTGRGLDELLAHLLDAINGLPGLANAAVILADADDRPAIRARLGAPDMALLLTATLERGPDALRARVLRQAAAPIVADAQGGVAATREETAMLAAPVVLDGAARGWVFVDGLLGSAATPADDLRLLTLVAEVASRLLQVAEAEARKNLDLAREVAFLRSKVSLRYRHVFSDGASPALRGLRAAADLAAVSDTPLLLLGEDGCGRGILARIIHELSPRAVRPFTVLPADTADPTGHLLGRAKALGTDSGPGLLEETDGGTLLIEDAHCLPPETCQHLARYLATGKFLRPGGSRPRHCTTRLLFTAPPAGISPELLAPTKPTVIMVPSLRERREDIPALLDQLLTTEGTRGGRRLTLTPKALKALETYDWPGNIREMEELVARLAVTAPEDRIDIADIPPEILAEGERPPVLPEDAAELRDLERQQVLNALERHNWVQSRAARELGLTLRQIGYRIRKYGLGKDGERVEEDA